METAAGHYYLGREVDIQSGTTGDTAVHYDSRHLVTHGICFGMTGSGKTGICIDLLEENALQGKPAIIIDPKGDITNLLLSFPNLDAASFKPWVNPEEAVRKGVSLDILAAQTAQKWRSGLQEWGITWERLKQMRETSAFHVYTPGSDAGIPVNIVSSLTKPEGLEFGRDDEVLQETMESIASALLGLIGIEADPVTSREHILLVNIIQHAWRAAEPLDLAKIILYTQSPPFKKLGVFAVDKLYPAKERMKLALTLNNLLAAPGFAAWTKGMPLDPARIMQSASGKPATSVFYLAHLNDHERMFFITLLLDSINSWMRRQAGSSELRALLYFDEIFGYMPPYPRNPASKRPLLTLLKQARAFGLGLMLVTQNPMDVDYKGLTNTGLWLVGKLQTDRDKMRVLEAMETASMENKAAALDRTTLDKLLSSLQSRQFVFHDTHGGTPRLIYSRWAMSYLRGPLTREEVRRLAQDHPRQDLDRIASQAVPPSATTTTDNGASASAAGGSWLASRPPTPGGIEERFLSPEDMNNYALREKMELPVMDFSGKQPVYLPTAMARIKVRFDEGQDQLVVNQELVRIAFPPGKTDNWIDVTELGEQLRFQTKPPTPGRYGGLPDQFRSPDDRARLKRDLINTVYQSATLKIGYAPFLKQFAQPDQSNESFQKKVLELIEDEKDLAVQKLKNKFEKKISVLQQRIEREQTKLEANERTLSQRRTEKVASAATSILGVFMGSRSRSGVGSYLSKQRMEDRTKFQVESSKQKIEQYANDLQLLEQELEQELAAIEAEWEGKAEIEEREIRLEKNDIVILDKDICYLWLPFAPGAVPG